MSSLPLQNHLLANRKRAALSQQDLSFLLGREGGAKICGYERFHANPNLETALAFEVIFQRPLRELFKGLFKQIEREVANRAKLLARRQVGRKPKWYTGRRAQTLSTLAEHDAKDTKFP